MLTDNQKDTLRWLVQQTRAGTLIEEFVVAWRRSDSTKESLFHGYSGSGKPPQVTTGSLEALVSEGLLLRTINEYGDYECTLTGLAAHAVDTDFGAPDTSFIKHLTPLADVTDLDPQIKLRCLPQLGAGAADPKMWDSAIRTAMVILEERLRSVGGITDPSLVGVALVNQVLGQHGTLASKFSVASEQQGYRDLFAGVVGAIRNRYGHHFVDPIPEDGGATIVFINLLLKMLEDLR